MSDTTIKNMRAECALCGKTVPTTATGLLYRHRPDGTRVHCKGSRLAPKQTVTRNEWITFLRDKWRIGDAIPVHNAMMNTNPPESMRDALTYTSPADIPEGLSIEDELAFLRQHARDYIDRMYYYLFDGRDTA